MMNKVGLCFGGKQADDGRQDLHSPSVRCSECNGSGVSVHSSGNEVHGHILIKETCRRCLGSGQYPPPDSWLKMLALQEMAKKEKEAQERKRDTEISERLRVERKRGERIKVRLGLALALGLPFMVGVGMAAGFHYGFTIPGLYCASLIGLTIGFLMATEVSRKFPHSDRKERSIHSRSVAGSIFWAIVAALSLVCYGVAQDITPVGVPLCAVTSLLIFPLFCFGIYLAKWFGRRIGIDINYAISPHLTIGGILIALITAAGGGTVAMSKFGFLGGLLIALGLFLLLFLFLFYADDAWMA